MKVGDKLVIVYWKVSPNAYTDQLGIAQPGIVAQKVYDIEVVETRKSKGNWGGQMYDGYRAVTVDGREFHCQWKSFDDTSSNAYANWTEPAAYPDRIEEYLLHEATGLMGGAAGRPLVTKDGKPFSHPRITKCYKHTNIYYYTDNYCYLCEFVDKKEKEDAQKITEQVQQPLGP